MVFFIFCFILAVILYNPAPEIAFAFCFIAGFKTRNDYFKGENKYFKLAKRWFLISIIHIIILGLLFLYFKFHWNTADVIMR